jgi:hypothetical protein
MLINYACGSRVTTAATPSRIYRSGHFPNLLGPEGRMTRMNDGDITYRPVVGGWRDHNIHGTP